MSARRLRPIEEVVHDEQLEVWVEELSWSIHEWIADFDDYDDKVAFFRRLKDGIRSVATSALEQHLDGT